MNLHLAAAASDPCSSSRLLCRSSSLALAGMEESVMQPCVSWMVLPVEWPVTKKDGLVLCAGVISA